LLAASTENIRDVFSILHDGVITHWTGDKNVLTLQVECSYLAKRIATSFSYFYIRLNDIHTLCLRTWPNPSDLPVRNLEALNDIFAAPLEILSADIREQEVVVECSQHNTAFNYCGGKLVLSCRDITVYDQDKNELSVDRLDEICQAYWNELRQQTIRPT
jgi:hypothetical protein